MESSSRAGNWGSQLGLTVPCPAEFPAFPPSQGTGDISLLSAEPLPSLVLQQNKHKYCWGAPGTQGRDREQILHLFLFPSCSFPSVVYSREISAPGSLTPSPDIFAASPGSQDIPGRSCSHFHQSSHSWGCSCFPKYFSFGIKRFHMFVNPSAGKGKGEKGVLSFIYSK